MNPSIFLPRGVFSSTGGEKKKAILRLCASIHYHIPNLQTPVQLKQHSLSIVLFVPLAALLQDPVSGAVSPCALHMAVKFHTEGRSQARQVHAPLFVIATQVKLFPLKLFPFKTESFRAVPVCKQSVNPVLEEHILTCDTLFEKVVLPLR